MADAGLANTHRLLLQGNFTAESGARATLRLIEMPLRPTAIFCSNDEMAMGLVSALHARSIDVPRDLSVVGFDDIVFAKTYIPALTTIHQPRLSIGEQAMSILLDQLEVSGESQLSRTDADARLLKKA